MARKEFCSFLQHLEAEVVPIMGSLESEVATIGFNLFGYPELVVWVTMDSPSWDTAIHTEVDVNIPVCCLKTTL